MKLHDSFKTNVYLQVVEELEVSGLCACAVDCARKLNSTCASLRPVRADDGVESSFLECDSLDGFEFRRFVGADAKDVLMVTQV